VDKFAVARGVMTNVPVVTTSWVQRFNGKLVQVVQPITWLVLTYNGVEDGMLLINDEDIPVNTKSTVFMSNQGTAVQVNILSYTRDELIVQPVWEVIGGG